MKKVTLIKLSLILLFAGLINSCGKKADHELVITNVNIINTETGEILKNQTVGIDSNRITKIYDTEVSASWSSTELDGENGYLIPGLWDMHAHYNWNEKESNRLLLANGVTGIREMWGNMDSTLVFRERNRDGHFGPDIYSAGVIIDGKPKVWDGSVEVTNAEEARAEVMRQIEEGVDFIKVYSRLNKEAFDAIAETAKENEVPFAGHVPNNISIYHAAKMGMASMEHMYGILPGASTMGDRMEKSQRFIEHEYIDSYDEAMFDSLCNILIENNTWLCPTLKVNKVFTQLNNHDNLKNTAQMDYVNSFLQKVWSSYQQDSARTAEELKTYNFLLPLVGKAHAKGVNILAGTDFPNPYTFPGFSMHDELQLLVESGLSELSALQAATFGAAKFMKKTDDFGSVAEGKVASLVLLSQNPLDDISHTKSIEAVIQRGKLYDKKALENLLASVKEDFATAKTPYSDVFRGIMSEVGFEKALDSLTILIDIRDPDYSLDESDMGFVMQDFYDADEKEQMMQYAEYMIKWFPTSSTVHTWAGEAMLFGENKERAIELLERALELDPENSRASENLEELQ